MGFVDCLGYVLSLFVEIYNITLWTLGDGRVLHFGDVVVGSLVMILAIHFLVPNFSH